MKSNKELRLEKMAFDWLHQNIEEPPKGWRTVTWICQYKKKNTINRQTCKRYLDKLVLEGFMPPPKQYKVGAHKSWYYFIGE